MKQQQRILYKLVTGGSCPAVSSSKQLYPYTFCTLLHTDELKKSWLASVSTKIYVSMPISNIYTWKTKWNKTKIYLANANTNEEKYAWKEINVYLALVVIKCLHANRISQSFKTEISLIPVFLLKNKSLCLNIGTVVYCELSWNYVVDSAHTGKAESLCYLCELVEKWKQIRKISSSIGSNMLSHQIWWISPPSGTNTWYAHCMD